MPNRTYSPELKAQVIAEWLGGATQNSLAKKYNLPRMTVVTWIRPFPRQVTIPELDLRQQFAVKVYQTALKHFDALDAHAGAATDAGFAGTLEGWADRYGELAKVAIALGAAIQRGSPEPITIEPEQLTDGVHTP